MKRIISFAVLALATNMSYAMDDAAAAAAGPLTLITEETVRGHKDAFDAFLVDAQKLFTKKETATGWTSSWFGETAGAWVGSGLETVGRHLAGEPQEAIDGAKVLPRLLADEDEKVAAFEYLCLEEGLALVNGLVAQLKALENFDGRFQVIHNNFMASLNPHVKERYRIPAETPIADMPIICTQEDSDSDDEEYRIPNPHYARGTMTGAYVSFLIRKTTIFADQKK